MSPSIEIRGADTVLDGELTGAVHLQVDRPMRTRQVIITLVGEELGGHLHQLLRSRQIIGRGELAPGPRRMHFKLLVPQDAPASFESPFGWIRYRLTVEIDLPWWPDPRVEKRVCVPPRAARVGVAPGRRRWLVDGKAVELSLASTAFAPGDRLHGEVRADAPRVRIALVGEVRVAGGRPDLWRMAQVDLPPGRFELRIPDTVAPAFTSQLLHVSWFLEVSAAGAALRQPVSVLPGGAGHALPSLVLPLGDGWQEEELGSLAADRFLVQRRTRLVGTATGGRLDIVATDGELRGELRFSCLYLGLRRLPDGGLSARSAAHAYHLQAALDSAPRPPGVRLLDLGDDQLVAAADLGSGHDLVDWLRTVADRFAAVRDRLVPPGDQAARLPHWRALAETLGGRLEPGALFVSAQRANLPVSIFVVWWGDRAVATRVEVEVSGLPVHLEEHERALELPGTDHAVDRLVAELDRRVAAVREKLGRGPFR